MGRLFDHHILDMIEFGVEHFISVAEFDTEHRAALGNRPSLIFIGPEWEQKEEYQKFSNLLVDILYLIAKWFFLYKTTFFQRFRGGCREFGWFGTRDSLFCRW
jgi:hypothetical protein